MSILGGALILGGAQLVGGLIQGSAAKKASEAQLKANQAAAEESGRQFDAQLAQYQLDQAYARQRYNYEQELMNLYRSQGLDIEQTRYGATKQRLSPYIATGESALAGMRGLLGIGEKDTMISAAEQAYQNAVASAKQKYESQRASGLTSAQSYDTTNLERLRAQLATDQQAVTDIDSQIAALQSKQQEQKTQWDKSLTGLEIQKLQSQKEKLDEALATTQSSFTTEEQAYNAAQTQQQAQGGQYESEYNQAIAAAEAQRQAAIEEANRAPTGIEAQRAAIASISESPEMQALTQQGESAILANAAATGGLRGGNTAGALAQFRPQILSDLINRQYERLGALSGMGQNAVLGGSSSGLGVVGGTAGYSGTQMGYPTSNAADYLQNAGAIQAGNILAQGNAWASIPSAIATGVGAYAGMGGFGGNNSGNSYMNWGNWGLKF